MLSVYSLLSTMQSCARASHNSTDRALQPRKRGIGSPFSFSRIYGAGGAEGFQAASWSALASASLVGRQDKGTATRGGDEGLRMRSLLKEPAIKSAWLPMRDKIAKRNVLLVYSCWSRLRLATGYFLCCSKKSLCICRPTLCGWDNSHQKSEKIVTSAMIAPFSHRWDSRGFWIAFYWRQLHWTPNCFASPCDCRIAGVKLCAIWMAVFKVGYEGILLISFEDDFYGEASEKNQMSCFTSQRKFAEKDDVKVHWQFVGEENSHPEWSYPSNMQQWTRQHVN